MPTTPTFTFLIQIVPPIIDENGVRLSAWAPTLPWFGMNHLSSHRVETRDHLGIEAGVAMREILGHLNGQGGFGGFSAFLVAVDDGGAA